MIIRSLLPIRLPFRRFGTDQKGQTLVIGLFVAVGLVMIAITVANVGMMAAEKIHLQDTADAAAYSAAVVQARYMNLTAYVNRAIVANYDAMAFNTALWAITDTYDHGSAALNFLLYVLSDALFAASLVARAVALVGAVLDWSETINLTATAVAEILYEAAYVADQIGDVVAQAVHHPLHVLNRQVGELMAQDEGAQDLNQYLEIYNTDILSTYQGILYAAMQSSRHEIIKRVAQKMDGEASVTTTLGLIAETVNSDELARAVDWVVRDPDSRDSPFDLLNEAFNDFAGEPPEEEGDLFDDLEALIPIDGVEIPEIPGLTDNEESKKKENDALLAAVTEASLNKFSAGRNRLGAPSFLRQNNLASLLGGSDIVPQLIVGTAIREGSENSAFESHVPFIARQRMRQVNFFGIGLSLPGFLKEFLDEGADGLSNILQLNLGHTSGDAKNDIGNNANLYDPERLVQCLLAGGCSLNSLNVFISALLFLNIPPIHVDDHWDGTTEVEPVDVIANPLFAPYPNDGPLGIPQYIEATDFGEELEDGVPKYDWKVDVDNVGFANYIYQQEGAQERPAGNSRGDNENFLIGPSIGVVAVKTADKVNTLALLDTGNDYSITALSRAQVYYERNPNREDELPSLFNPHWSARLAPVNSDDTPIMLSKGIPFVASMGLSGIDALGLGDLVDIEIPGVLSISPTPIMRPTH